MRETPDYLKTILVGVATATIVASVLGSVTMILEVVTLKEDFTHQIDQITNIQTSIHELEAHAREGSRWTREQHDGFAKDFANDINTHLTNHDARLDSVERKTDLLEWKLNTMDEKLDEIISKL